jgi:hypothetical protein
MPLWHRLPIGLGFISPVIALAGVWWVCPILFWALWAQVQYDYELPKAIVSRRRSTNIQDEA